MNPITPGEILRCELLEPLGISQNQLARDLDVPPARINEIVKGQRTLTAEPLAGDRRKGQGTVGVSRLNRDPRLPRREGGWLHGRRER